MMSENSLKVLNYLKTANDNKTAADIADALGLGVKTVNAAFTMALQRKGLGARVVSTVKDADGVDVEVKYLTLTPEGKSYIPDDNPELKF